MGAVHSKRDSTPQQSVQRSFTLPPDPVPYQGPILQYAFRTIMTEMKAHFTFSHAPGQNVVTSNLDEHYPYLAQNYNEGFKLIQFLKIPFTQSQSGMFSMSVKVPYQAVYCRIYAGQPHVNSWQLKIEKSMIFMHRLGGGMLFSFSQRFTPPTSDLSHMYEIIQKNAAVGGRFVCMEQTGTVQSQGMSMAMSGVSPGMGTDLFFNMPLHPNPVIYTYMAISVPIPLKTSYGFGSSIDMVCDWMGNLTQYLNQGWRLADIYMDDVQQMSQQFQHAAFPQMSINSIWFFEKELSRCDDPQPLYEGTVVEYHVKAKVGFGSVSSDFDITQLCQEMGNRGWKLTCCLQTPKVVSSGFMSAKVAVLLFFQRRLNRPPLAPGMQVPGEGGTAFPPTAPPPSYDSAIGGGKG